MSFQVHALPAAPFAHYFDLSDAELEARGARRVIARSDSGYPCRVSLRDATQMADTIYRTARGLFDQVGDQGPYRLLGCGISDLINADGADRSGDLLDPQAKRRGEAERATDEIRARFGPDAILKGRALR